MDQDSRIDELLDQWEEAYEQGQELGPEDLCRDDPELIEPLKKQIAALRKINGYFDAYEAEPVEQETKANSEASVQFDATLVNLRFHDRGGLGEVFKAHDHELHRDVAVKFLHEKIARNEEERVRFHQEAEITGRLDHPGVVPVYATGKTANAQPFYVMRFIHGDTLDDAIKEFHRAKKKQSTSERQVRLRKLLFHMVSVCQTIGYAHTRGIVHRDIKPKNIMLGKYGETLVVDWGLAIPFSRKGQFRVKDEKTLVPQSNHEQDSGREGEGTPIFMSPEQASGNPNIGPASDIHSLGNVLYRLLTGEFAFDGKSPVDIKIAIMKGDFAPPRNIDASIPKALEAICVNAMQVDPGQRYETAIEMADDLENFLADAPIASYQYSSLEKAGRFIHRNQSLFTTMLLAAAALVAVMMFASTKLYQMQRRTQNSLNVAVDSQVESLNMTCLMTARSIQYNLEARLIALEELATRPDFIRLVSNANEDAGNPELAQLLKDSRGTLQQRLPSVSWFVVNARGKLVARVSDDQDSLQQAKPWQWRRPYFHGGDSDLPADAIIPAPVNRPNLSPVFFGKYQDRELCSLSVPIQNTDDELATIGVLVMTIQMGQFEPLIKKDALDAHNHRFASLVETRGELQGTLLHHPGIKDMAASEIRKVHVCESVFSSLQEIDCAQTHPVEIKNYVDPLGAAYSGTWNSTAIPIQIRSRDNRTVACGWYLMVQDRPFVLEE